MPIVNQQVQVNTQADGSMAVTVTLWDESANPYLQTFRAPAGFNVDARVADMIVERNEALIEAEVAALLGA